MKRGELWTASGGPDYSGKPRPVLIVQDDHFDATGSITICPLTSHAIDADLFRPTIAPSEANGLREPSFAMIDKIATVPRAKLGRQVGALHAAEMAPINQAMLVFLGLAGVRG
jgi:mRNA interferase MazF